MAGRRAAHAVACTMAAALAAAPCAARGWDARGHRIVARLAEARLDRRARDAARALLGGAHLAEVATWADAEARRRPETAPWHYMDFDVDASGRERPRCPAGACVAARVRDFSRTLADRGASAAERARALRFLVHLVADAHQPFHAGRPQDRGGNLVAVVTPWGEETNLHRAYDALPSRCRFPRKERAAARALDAAISPSDARAWRGASPEAWVMESHVLALRAMAAVIPAGGSRFALAGDGGERCAMAGRQMEKAGVRLAEVIEGALGP